MRFLTFLSTFIFITLSVTVSFAQNQPENTYFAEISLIFPEDYKIKNDNVESLRYSVSIISEEKVISKIESKKPIALFAYNDEISKEVKVVCDVYLKDILILKGQSVISFDELKNRGRIEVKLSKIFGSLLVTFDGVREYLEKKQGSLKVSLVNLFDDTHYSWELGSEVDPVILQLTPGIWLMRVTRSLKDKTYNGNDDRDLALSEIVVFPNVLSASLVMVKGEEFFILKDTALLSKVVFIDTSKNTVGFEKEGPIVLNRNVEINGRTFTNWSSAIYPGLRNIYASFSNGKISKITFQDSFPRFVRVLISSKMNSVGAMISYFFENVTLELNGSFNLSIFDMSNLIYRQILQINYDRSICEIYELDDFAVIKLKIGSYETLFGPFSKDTRIYFKPSDEKARFVVRNRSSNKYSGIAEITYVNTRGFVIINDVPIEEYLYSVVAGEMPSSYHIEALKAQAIAARTYTIDKILSDRRYSLIGANLDDSINFQVYNTQKASENAIQAVNQTVGQILTFNGRPAATFYYAVSSGFSLDPADVFGNKISYLNSKPISVLNDTMDLISSNGGFDSFLKIWDRDLLRKMGFVEVSNGFFGWKIEYSSDEIIQRIDGLKNATIKNIFRESEKLTIENSDKTLSVNEKMTSSSEINDIEIILDDSNNTESNENESSPTSFETTPQKVENTIYSIYVSKRGPGGIVTEVKIEMHDREITVVKEDIRRLFSPANKVIQLLNNSLRNDLTSLPSNVFTIEMVKNIDGKAKIILYGRGYGHGVGMSQVAANNLAREHNWDYSMILSFFYEGTQLVNVLKN